MYYIIWIIDRMLCMLYLIPRCVSERAATDTPQGCVIVLFIL